MMPVAHAQIEEIESRRAATSSSDSARNGNGRSCRPTAPGIDVKTWAAISFSSPGDLYAAPGVVYQAPPLRGPDFLILLSARSGPPSV